MRSLLVGLTIVAVAYAANVEVLDMDSIIKAVNEANTTWTAGQNFDSNMPLHYFKRLMGSKKNENGMPLELKSYSGSDIPAEFDARKQWPHCPTISHLRDQGNCGSCWAVAAASAFSDRVCIASNGKFTTPMSAEELLSCCEDCGFGCGGGDPAEAWQYFKDHGIVTGGDYGSGIGCQPYSIEPCEHHTTGPRPACSSLPSADTPDCKNKCTNSKYTIPLKSDIHRAKYVYSLGDVKAAQEDIMKFGSIEAAFDVYADFVTYKSGVYQHTTGSLLGGHAVRVIGWGTENGTPYWLVANSWNSDWGDKGFFKIARGTDECGFDSGLVAGQIA